MAADQLTFVTHNGQRQRYRVTRRGDDEAELLATGDERHARGAYLAGSDGTLKAADRSKWLREINDPPPPRLIGVLRRISDQPSGSELIPRAPAQPSQPATRTEPAPGAAPGQPNRR